MNDVAPRPAPAARLPDIGPMQSMLISNNLALRDVRKWTRDILCAVQPLTIDGKEIFTDTVLVEFIRYADADQMNREAGTLTLKKSAFGDFEASMTPIPKYCFRDDGSFTTLQVHSVPRFTMEDILFKCENDFPSLYTWENFRFYKDWTGLVVGRIRHNPPAGKHRLLKTAFALPKYLFPPPPHIPLDERKRFAAQMLRIVAEHHRSKIYHDRISERTIFFPTAGQPLFLSNYSGVPAPLLGELIPAELMAVDAVSTYGPQCRDLYCMALLCYRIMTGERHDGTSFMLKSPRPLRTVLTEIAAKSGLTPSLKKPFGPAPTIPALYKFAKQIVLLLPSLISGRTFTAWRKLNRATGGLWRIIPIVGPFCDIFQPTQCASALRYILDRHWFMQFVSRKSIPGRQSTARGPEISLLTGVFRDRQPRRYPHFESTLNVLISDSGFKRMAFDSLMESGHAAENDVPFALSVRKVFAGLAILAIIAGIILTAAFLRNSGAKTENVQTSAMVDSTRKSILPLEASESRGNRAPDVSVPDSTPVAPKIADGFGAADQPAVINEAPYPAKSAAAATNGKQTLRQSTTPVSGGKLLTTEPDAERTTKAAVRSKNEPRRSAASSPAKSIPAPCGALSPALGFSDVAIVVGVTDSCNPGNLKYQPAGNRDETGSAKPPVLPPKLFIVRRSYSGFGPIESVWQCRTDGCDKSLYYKTIEGKVTARPAFVKTGDAVSPDKNGLQLFIKSRMAMYRK